MERHNSLRPIPLHLTTFVFHTVTASVFFLFFVCCFFVFVFSSLTDKYFFVIKRVTLGSSSSDNNPSPSIVNVPPTAATQNHSVAPTENYLKKEEERCFGHLSLF